MEPDLVYCTVEMMARRATESVCIDEDCQLSGGYAHIGPCESCSCGAEHAIEECPQYLLKDFQAIASKYGKIKVSYVDDAYLKGINIPKEFFLNRSCSVGEEEIVLGIYDDPILRRISFFHELGHIVDRKDHPSRYTIESGAWTTGLKIAEDHGITFSVKAIVYAFEQLETYAKTDHV
jgi:hypothetical protein